MQAEVGIGLQAEIGASDRVLQKMLDNPELGILNARSRKGQVWVELPRTALRAMLKWAKDTWPDLHLSAITGTDSGEHLECIYHFVVDKVLVNARVKLDPANPEVDSVTDILPAADSYEREMHDLLGVSFAGRETTPRLVLPDTWQEGVYPLRRARGDGDHA